MSDTFKIKFYISTSTEHPRENGKYSFCRGTVAVTLQMKTSADPCGREVYEQKFNFDETQDEVVVARDGVEEVMTRFTDAISALMRNPT